ncbi:MAG: hypothetical protein QG602_3320 [Verrucomicrobiota bacterium]|nr:hypothetical protein [Verrucomicrobiota bacterium]
MPSTDPFTGHPSHLEGPRLPGAEGWSAVLDGHGQRLRALDQLGEKAAECSFAPHQDRGLVLAQEDEVGLLELAEERWRELGEAIRRFRACLPLVRLEDFGFDSESEDPFESNTARLRRIGGGVEALAYADTQDSVYKFFLFREGGDVGATFAFARGEGEVLHATAVPGSYRRLFEKLRLTHQIGMPTEIAGITPEGVVVAKQTFGRMLPEQTDVSGLDPARFIPIPSRFLRADRDHPRLAFFDGNPWLVADTHDRNIVVAADGSWRVIDLVAAPLPPEWLGVMPLFADWIERARHNPHAEILAAVNDDEL